MNIGYNNCTHITDVFLVEKEGGMPNAKKKMSTMQPVQFLISVVSMRSVLTTL